MSCQAILVAGGVVSALCIDQRNGCVVAGVHDVMKYAMAIGDMSVYCVWSHASVLLGYMICCCINWSKLTMGIKTQSVVSFTYQKGTRYCRQNTI